MAKITVQAFDQIQIYFNELVDIWKAQQENVKKSWFFFNNSYLVKAVTFLMNSLDGLIKFVEPLIPAGEDKKEAVMTIVSQLFDKIAAAAIPMILTPFVPMIKKIFMEIVVSNAIDFFVDKYNEGAWKMSEETPPAI